MLLRGNHVPNRDTCERHGLLEDRWVFVCYALSVICNEFAVGAEDRSRRTEARNRTRSPDTPRVNDASVAEIFHCSTPWQAMRCPRQTTPRRDHGRTASGLAPTLRHRRSRPRLEMPGQLTPERPSIGIAIFGEIFGASASSALANSCPLAAATVPASTQSSFAASGRPFFR